MSDPILEIGGAGLNTTDEKVKSLVNRMVNSETPGFKSSDVTIRSFPIELEAAQTKVNSEIPKIDGTYYDQVQGSLISTGNPTDVALGSPGFFVVMCPWGEGYTRDGRFSVDKEGRLVTTVGNYPVLGSNGPVVINPASKIVILETGEIKADTDTIGKLRVVNFEKVQQLQSVNGVVFRDPTQTLNAAEVESPRIVQGFIEASNAKAIDQMMDLVYLSRLYNMDTKIISTRDAQLSKAIEIGKAQ